LRWASYQRHLEVVKELLKAGANVHAVDDWALTRASNKGYLEVVKELLKAGADVHADNDCALRWARDAGHQDVVDFLEDYITNEKKLKSKVVKESLLEKFVEDSDPVTDMGIGIRAQISRWMKETGILSIISNRVIAYTAEHGKIEWIKFLLSLKNYPQTNIDIGLRFASYHGHLDVVKELLKAGADVHAVHDLALHWASDGGNLEIVKELLKAGADANQISDIHIHNLEQEGYKEIVELLRKSKKSTIKESLNEKFVEDSDPVTDMGIGTRAQISRWLKERYQEDTNEVALAICAETGKLDWVKFLIAAGANVHYVDDYALRHAILNGHFGIVKELLKAGADVRIAKNRLSMLHERTPRYKELKDLIDQY
jgi:ankyrin repeat protein